MRRPTLTRRVVEDLVSLAAVARAALASCSLTPAQKSQVLRAIAYIEALAQWRNQGAANAKHDGPAP